MGKKILFIKVGKIFQVKAELERLINQKRSGKK